MLYVTILLLFVDLNTLETVGNVSSLFVFCCFMFYVTILLPFVDLNTLETVGIALGSLLNQLFKGVKHQALETPVYFQLPTFDSHT